jgi:hypothetical protein
MVCYDDGDEITCPNSGEAFYGQDAQYNGNQPSYTLSANGLTLYDSVTGLTWTQSPDLDGDGDIDVNDKLTFAEAQTYANTTLNPQSYGGYNDWRLPTIKELYSLIDYRGTDPDPMAGDSSGLRPFIDADVFEFAYGDTSAGERIIDSQWATSSIYVSTVMGGQTAMFGVNFADGRTKGYPAEGSPGGTDKTYYVRFARLWLFGLSSIVCGAGPSSADVGHSYSSMLHESLRAEPPPTRHPSHWYVVLPSRRHLPIQGSAGCSTDDGYSCTRSSRLCS